MLDGFEWLHDERGTTTEQHDQWRVWGKKPLIKKSRSKEK
jgi:hypothetical protein